MLVGRKLVVGERDLRSGEIPRLREHDEVLALKAALSGLRLTMDRLAEKDEETKIPEYPLTEDFLITGDVSIKRLFTDNAFANIKLVAQLSQYFLRQTMATTSQLRTHSAMIHMELLSPSSKETLLSWDTAASQSIYDSSTRSFVFRLDSTKVCNFGIV